MSIEWTNEKHSLYLKSMEASFVNQLYSSMDLLGCQVQEEMSDPKLSQQVHCNTAPSGQVGNFSFVCLYAVHIAHKHAKGCVFIDENAFYIPVQGSSRGLLEENQFSKV